MTQKNKNKTEKYLQEMGSQIEPRDEWVENEVEKFVTVLESGRSTGTRFKLFVNKNIMMGFKNIAQVVGLAIVAVGIIGATAVLASQNTVPGDTLYSAKRFGENVELSAARLFGGDVAEVSKHLDFADNRIDEMDMLLDGQEFALLSTSKVYAQENEQDLDIPDRDYEKIKLLAEDYEQHIDDATESAERVDDEEKIDELTQRVVEATLTHQERLSEVYEQVPEEAREGLDRALERSTRGHEEALERLPDEEQRERVELPEGVEQGEVDEFLEGLENGKMEELLEGIEQDDIDGILESVDQLDMDEFLEGIENGDMLREQFDRIPEDIEGMDELQDEMPD